MTPRPATTSGRFVSTCGAIGVTSSPSTSGCTTGPPAARLYAVDPLALEMMTPSPLIGARAWPSIDTATPIIRESAALLNTTSLNTRRDSKGLEPRSVSTAISARSSSSAVPAWTASRPVNISSTRVSVRNSRLPKLTARIGAS